MKKIAFTDSVTTCECCGRTELKGTYCVLVDDNEYYLGSSCAQKKGFSKADVKDALTAYDKAVKLTNSVIRRSLKGDRSKYNIILEWCLNNPNKMFDMNILK